MARPRLRRPDQPAAIQLVLGIYESFASLRLAVVLIGALAVVLCWATFVESKYGTPAVHFGIYQTWWFALLMLLLGVNVLCAALVRYPWKKYQTGFLITHSGIIVLLVGCLMSRLGGIDAQLPVFEGKTAHIAYEDTQHFQLSMLNDSGSEQRKIPFASGPFNWADYKSLFPFPWRLSHRDRGTIYDRDGIRLEVLDYYSDSELRRADPLKLQVKSSESEGEWASIELNMQMVRDPTSPHSTLSVGSQEKLPGGGAISFWVAYDGAETRAFLESRPERPIGDAGTVVLHAAGKRFEFAVEDLREQPQWLGSSGLSVQAGAISSKGVELKIRDAEGGDAGASEGQMILLADAPEMNRYDRKHSIFGTFWARPADPADSQTPEATSGADRTPSASRRIDIIQGSDGELYYRTWNSPEFGVIDRLSMASEKIVAFAGSSNPIELRVESFTPHDQPGWRVEPIPFRSGKNKALKQRRAKVRMTVGAQVEEFWLRGTGMRVFPGIDEPDQERVVLGGERQVALVLASDSIDVGFELYLHKFQRKLDPGTSQASHYSSIVDLRDREHPEDVLHEKVLINLNQPKTFRDPNSGRSYRLYQESFFGPWKPGEAQYELMVDGVDPPDQLFVSVLTVNYDPGRGVKYFGCMMIVAGVATMFYMKAYFFRPRGEKTPPTMRSKSVPEEAREPRAIQPASRG
jgi:hypothetical protein